MLLFSLFVFVAIVLFSPLEEQNKGIALWTVAGLHGLVGLVWLVVPVVL